MRRARVQGGPELASNDGFQLTCVVANMNAKAFGAACSPDPAAGMRCADDSLCIEAAGFAGSPFCSQLCRNDADCPEQGALPRVPDAGARRQHGAR